MKEKNNLRALLKKMEPQKAKDTVKKMEAEAKQAADGGYLTPI